MLMDDERKWRNRLLAHTAARAFGLAVMLLGIAIMYTDLVRVGGWPQVGAIVAIMGVIDAVFAPRMLKKLWDAQDQQGR
jgi:hypothetical protein